MHFLKHTGDLLALLGSHVSIEDMTDYILCGLDDGYRSVINGVNARDNPITFDDLLETLLIQELSITAAQQQTPAPLTALNAQVRPNYNNKPRPAQLPAQSNQHPGNRKAFLGKCQWCNVRGHVLFQCRTFRQQHLGIPPPPRDSPQVNTATVGPPQTDFFVDNGATHHITNDLANMAIHHPYTGPDSLFMRNGSGLNISHSRTLLINDLSLSNVLCVLSMKQKIIFVSQVTKQTISAVLFLPHSFYVKDLQTGQTTHKGSCIDGLYQWPAPTPAVHTVRKDSLPSWHHKLGHPSSSIFKFISQHFSLGTNQFQQSDCNSCQISKSYKLPFHESTLILYYPLEIIFSDVWTSSILSIDGLRCYCMFVDHFTRYIWLYPMKRKSDVQIIFPKFKTLVENFRKQQIKILYTDNGGEYIGLRPFLSNHGISNHTTPPHTPEHNGISKRRNRHIAEIGLALLHHSGIPLTYWPHAMTIAAYLINCLSTPILKYQSPYFKLHNISPDYHKLKCFGCLCFPWIKPYANHKLAPKSAMCVFVGYSADQDAYLCLDPTTGRIYTSRHVKFVESEFSFSSLATQTQALAPDSTLAFPNQNKFTQHPATPNELAHITHPSSPSSPMPNDLAHTTQQQSPSSQTISELANPLKHLHPLHQTPLRSPKTFKYPRLRLQHPMN